MKTKKEKIYQANNLSAMARYIKTTPTNLHFYKNNKPEKFEILKLGWKAKCESEIG